MGFYYGITLALLLYGAILKTLEHFDYRLPDAIKFLAERWQRILRRIYIFVAVVFSLYFLFTLVYVFPFTFQNTQLLNLITLYVLTLLAFFGIWTPVLSYTKNNKFKRIINIIGACLLGAMFVLFWITQWPAWETPALLTSIIVFTFILLLVYSLIKKRKARRSC